jgi:hypothetical protein
VSPRGGRMMRFQVRGVESQHTANLFTHLLYLVGGRRGTSWMSSASPSKSMKRRVARMPTQKCVSERFHRHNELGPDATNRGWIPHASQRCFIFLSLGLFLADLRRTSRGMSMDDAGCSQRYLRPSCGRRQLRRQRGKEYITQEVTQGSRIRSRWLSRKAPTLQGLVYLTASVGSIA